MPQVALLFQADSHHVLGPDFNWLVDMRSEPPAEAEQRLADYMLPGDNTALVTSQPDRVTSSKIDDVSGTCSSQDTQVTCCFFFTLFTMWKKSDVWDLQLITLIFFSIFWAE